MFERICSLWLKLSSVSLFHGRHRTRGQCAPSAKERLHLTPFRWTHANRKYAPCKFIPHFLDTVCLCQTRESQTRRTSFIRISPAGFVNESTLSADLKVPRYPRRILLLRAELSVGFWFYVILPPVLPLQL